MSLGTEAVGLHLQACAQPRRRRTPPGNRAGSHTQLDLAQGNVRLQQGTQADLHVLDVGKVHARDEQDVIALFQQRANDVVIDTPGDDNDVVRTLLEESDDILLIAGMDLPHIKNVKVGLRALREANIPLSKVKLVVNRANSGWGSTSARLSARCR